MPIVNPSRSDVHVNGPLTNMSLAFWQAAENFVATRTFQTMGRSKRSDIYFTYPRGEFNRHVMEKRAPSTLVVA